MNLFELHHGDCLAVLRGMAWESVDAIVTDSPYGLSFMGKRWDYDVPSVEVWAECLRVLKPGGHLLAFAGTRTQHRMAVRIEDAGFEIRDLIAWVYGSGFPKSLDVSKAIDKLDAAEVRRDRQLRFTAWMRSTGLTATRIDTLTGTNMGGHYTTAASQPAVATREHLEALRDHIPFEVPDWVEALVDERTVESENFKRREVVGTETRYNEASGIVSAGRDERTLIERKITEAHTDAARQWQGWGTALKPALEPITVARKPLAGTVAENVLAHGTGALNIDGCRVGDTVETWPASRAYSRHDTGNAIKVSAQATGAAPPGRWPANLIHDGSEEVLAAFPQAPGQSGAVTGRGPSSKTRNTFGLYNDRPEAKPRGDSSSAARFFYCAKASRRDRDEGCEGFAPKEAAHRNAFSGLPDQRMAQEQARLPAKNHHPTVKPTELMRYLCRLVTPPGGVVLDPFTGSGSTGKAAMLEGFRFIGIEREAEYVEIARARIEAVMPKPEPPPAVEPQLALFP